ncbi:MAG: transferase hexapeptide repeat family protein [Flavobacteriales bacterium]|nr:transferase hexapeptide repeat family protein [Flavobacteriales bacterium]
MANIFRFGEYIPVVHPTAFVHPNATVTGNVIIGAHVYIGPGAALRGDWGQIVIEDGCNVQENCTLHMFPGVQVLLQQGAHIGHGAIIHGATIGKNCLVGMNAVIMDRVVVGSESVIGALTLVLADTIIEPRSVVAGNPGKVIKQVSDEMLKWKTEGTAWYQRLPQECRDGLMPCEPLREVPESRSIQSAGYKTWNETK